MRQRKKFTRNEALKKFSELRAKFEKRMATDQEILKDLKALEYKILKDNCQGAFDDADSAARHGLSRSSTISKVAEAYISECKREALLSAHTICNYSSNLRSIKPLSEVKIGTGAAELKRIFDEATKGMKPNTLKTRRSIYRNLFAWAAENGIISSVPNI